MAKKTTEKDVLIVRDEKTGEISVVAGLNADGSPKRTPAKAENAQSFLQFDRHGDVLDNFFKNFFRQCKEPSRFGFYRFAADQADKLMEVMKDLLKDPEANKELLAPHKVDTSGYEKQVKEEQTAGMPEQKQEGQPKETQKQEEMEKKQEQNQESPQQQAQGRRGYQPIDESKINWQELEEKWGVKRDDLEKSGDLNKMLNYGKSDLVKVSPKFGGEAFELDARLSFKKDGEGNDSLVPHFIRKEQKLDEYKEHKFSDEDRKNLRETGNLGRVVDIVDKETGEIIPSFISIDRKTNEITDIPANKVRIPERIGKTEITKQEQDMLRAGLPVRDKLIERNDGSIGISIFPVLGSAFNETSQSFSFVSTSFCFLMTKTTASLSDNATAILLESPAKSPVLEVSAIASMGLLSSPTPTRFPPVALADISIPTNPSSTRSCV